jgi:hypothetical protein
VYGGLKKYRLLPFEVGEEEAALIAPPIPQTRAATAAEVTSVNFRSCKYRDLAANVRTDDHNHDSGERQLS